MELTPSSVSVLNKFHSMVIKNDVLDVLIISAIAFIIFWTHISCVEFSKPLTDGYFVWSRPDNTHQASFGISTIFFIKKLCFITTRISKFEGLLTLTSSFKISYRLTTYNTY